jgi:TrmH family RNA methyltransferase
MPTSQPAGLVPAGPGHPRVEQFRNVKQNRRPRSHGAIALEGMWAIRSAAAAGVPIDAVFVCVALLRGDEAATMLPGLRAAGAATYEVSERVLRRMVDRDGPDGLAAIARLPTVALADLAIRRSTRVVVADSCELPGNLGTIIRTADGAGAAAVVLTDCRVRLTHPLVLKASMGTIFSVPVIAAERTEAFAWLRAAGFTIIAADPAAAVSYREVTYVGPLAVVVGSERYGLAAFWREAADTVVSIPMLGTADSLNVGHATALLLYEALHRQAREPER